MAITITKTDEKPLLARKEVTAHILFDGKATPSNDAIRKEIATGMKVDEKTVAVRHIYTAFGSSQAEITAFVYKTEEDLKKFEPKVKEKKAKKGEAPAEGKAE